MRKGSSLKYLFKWLQKFKEISTLGELISSNPETKYIPQVESKNNFTYNKWTLLKLMFLQLYTPLYVSIIGKRYAEFNYIDLFAGSGLNKFEDTDILISGSPVIALSFAPKTFTNAYLVENESSKLSLLKRRVNLLKDLSGTGEYRDYIFTNLEETKIQVMFRDANQAIKKIYDEVERRHAILLQELHKGCHNLVFIDPFGLEFERRSLERILDASVMIEGRRYRVRSDIILLLNSYGIGMQAYNVIHYNYDDTSLRKHLGNVYFDYIKKYADKTNKRIIDLSRHELSTILSEYYYNIFRKHGYIIKTVRLPLKLETQQFDLIFACSRTGGGNPFLEGVDYIKNMLEGTNYKLVDSLKEYILTGKLPGILKYMIKNPEEALQRYKTAKRYGIN